MWMYSIVCLLNKPFMFVASAIIYAYCILNEPSVFLFVPFTASIFLRILTEEILL